MLQNLATRLFYDVKYKHLVQAIANVNVAGVAFLKQVTFFGFVSGSEVKLGN